jgi:membrane protein
VAFGLGPDDWIAMSRDRLVALGREFVEQFQRDDASGMAAELAYRWLFAVFPFGLFLAALGAFVAAAAGIDNPAQQIVDGLGDNLPAGIASGVQPELERVIGEQRPGLASIGALAALWAATSGTMTIVKAMNRAYGVEETRSAVRKYAIGIGLTIGAAVGLIVSFVTIVGGALLTEQVASELGVGATAWAVINLARWPLVFALLAVAVSVVLRIGPNMTPSWRWSLVGGTVFAIGWLAATFLFALYVSNFADYGATYGTLAGVIVLMLWFYVTALVLLAAGEVVALATKRTEPERLQERRDAIRAHLDLRNAAETVTGKVKDAAAAVRETTPSAPAIRGRVTSASVRPARRAAAMDGRPRGKPPTNELPTSVVALFAGAVAVAVAYATTRLPRR